MVTYNESPKDLLRASLLPEIPTTFGLPSVAEKRRHLARERL